MSHLAYVRIDKAAQSGRFHSLKAEDGTLHCGHWNAAMGRWAYSSDAPIQKRITHYCARLAGNPKPEKD